MGTLRQLRDNYPRRPGHPKRYFETRLMILLSCQECEFFARCFNKARKTRQEERDRLLLQKEKEEEIIKREMDKSLDESIGEIEKHAEKRKNGNIT